MTRPGSECAGARATGGMGPPFMPCSQHRHWRDTCSAPKPIGCNSCDYIAGIPKWLKGITLVCYPSRTPPCRAVKQAPRAGEARTLCSDRSGSGNTICQLLTWGARVSSFAPGGGPNIPLPSSHCVANMPLVETCLLRTSACSSQPSRASWCRPPWQTHAASSMWPPSPGAGLSGTSQAPVLRRQINAGGQAGQEGCKAGKVHRAP